MLALAAQRLGRTDGLLFVGDQLDTDIKAAREAGWDSVLVLSGIGEWESLVGQDITPTWIVRTLGDLDGPEPPRVRAASPDELADVEMLLESEGFDADGAGERIDRTLVAVDHDKRIVGTVAWDIAGESAHLRGFVVAPQERGHGTGSHLVARALQALTQLDVHLAWMLTPGADGLFEGLGFYRVHRDRVPAEVLATATLGGSANNGRVLMRRLPTTNGGGTP